MKIAMVMVKFSVFNIYVVGIVGVLLFILAVEGIVLGIKKLVENRELKKQQAQADDIRKEKKRAEKKPSVSMMLIEDNWDHAGEKPVIKVEDVTMEFHLSSSTPSGLKDYLIQMLKRQITYRKLYALYHVSFNVYKGEVVGIIGTNGSGKSTILKIISGALKPTKGKVYVDKKKIQLLTLGTGFDVELTARENVYLNGSIIGYSRKFLDEHYDEIVEFAELQDFMEEKVKNFSSGMVSRLGFSIATAGDAAEILILDEVLSVGDEFFKKKSLKRVKEMIHGGSTVLMVSHSLQTILDNCSKVVWIEQGELRMIGEPKTVCEAYRSSKAEGE
ncbi:ABC transporter ATP-binding protein [Roseburia zhanii]